MVGRSKVWKLSKLVDGVDKLEVSCNLCPARIKYVGNTTNIARHLEFKHPVEYAKLLEEHGQDSSNVGVKKSSVASTGNQKTKESDKSYYKLLIQRRVEQREQEMREKLAIQRILKEHQHQQELEFLGLTGEDVSTTPRKTRKYRSTHWLWHQPEKGNAI